MSRSDEPEADDALFGSERRVYVLAVLAIVVGIALVGSLDKHRDIAGGALLLGWLGAVYALHRLGRAGSKRRSEP